MYYVVQVVVTADSLNEVYLRIFLDGNDALTYCSDAKSKNGWFAFDPIEVCALTFN